MNEPYIIFKDKNIRDTDKRKTSWKKARPIAPQTKHPMRKLFGLTGKALSFLTSRCEGDHFVLNHGGQLRNFLEETSRDLGKLGDLDYATADIEGCFPNMPKEAIKMGLRKQLKSIQKRFQVDSVSVPTNKNKKCTLRHMPFRGWKSSMYYDRSKDEKYDMVQG